jgi:zinc/manganese transport system ATP-binding protein
MNAVELAGVSVALGGREVLGAIELTIGAGEFVGVLGANGAGKTTLLRAILGLVTPRAGRIAVYGAPARRGNPDIGYMPQMRGGAAGLRLRGWDAVAAAWLGHLWGLPLPGKAGRREVDRALALVGASGLARRALADLSGGERQRLLLAQAILGRPRLLLLDEPLMSLDPHRQAAVVEVVRGLRDELGLAVLFTAHDINPLLGAMDRVLYLGGGRAAIGTVGEVVTGPVLSRLYGSLIEVIRLDDRIFVVGGGIEGVAACAPHDHAAHDQAPHNLARHDHHA